MTGQEKCIIENSANNWDSTMQVNDMCTYEKLPSRIKDKIICDVDIQIDSPIQAWGSDLIIVNKMKKFLIKQWIAEHRGKSERKRKAVKRSGF